MLSIDRRLFLGGLAAAPCASPQVTAAASLPLCSYSMTRGWGRQRERILARRAIEDDPSGVPEVVLRIQRAFGFDNEIDVFIAKGREDNAFATVADGRKLLVVDVGFLHRLNDRSGTQWAAIQVIAHEVGHHIAGFSYDDHACELNADYWSGQALHRLGASQAATRSAFLAEGTEHDTPTHPSRSKRIAAIVSGWSDAEAGVIDYSRCLECQG